MGADVVKSSAMLLSTFVLGWQWSAPKSPIAASGKSYATLKQHKKKLKTLLVGIVISIGLNSCGFIFGQNNPDAIKNEQAIKLYKQAQEEDEQE